jgi:signal transduction histidine kinase
MRVNIEFIVVIILVTIIIVSFVFLLFRIFIRRIISEKNLQYQREIQHQADMLEQSVKVQESERERIAIMLHDDIGNKLNVLSVWLNNPDAWNSERSKEIIISQIPDLITTTRSISHSLYPVNLERFGLINTIEELINSVESSLKIELILNHKYTPRNISLEVQFYRIIQEFLSNVIKHAGASRMVIGVRDSEKSLCLVLSDNGKGFDVNALKKGMGLRNIELRLNSMGAAFKWKSVINNGSRLIITIPGK